MEIVCLFVFFFNISSEKGVETETNILYFNKYGPNC